MPAPSFILRESCGLAHEPQVVTLELPPELANRPTSLSVFSCVDQRTGRVWPAQRSQREPRQVFVFGGLPADTRVELSANLEMALAPEQGHLCRVSEINPGIIELSNGLISVRCFLGQNSAIASMPTGESSRDVAPSGPLLGLRTGNGPWRGKTWFDCHERLLEQTAQLSENGPVRTVYEYRARFTGGGHYELTLTLDTKQCFARVNERYNTAEGDQLVWEFAEADLPEELHMLDSTAGVASRRLDYAIDRRQARIWCWTQQSQLHDLIDGCAFSFCSSEGTEVETADAIGMVALAGGNWRGRRLNHIEIWARRWVDGVPWTRRLTPPESRADAMPGPGHIPARGQSQCRPRLTAEAWLGPHGAREFALVVAPCAALWPRAGRRTESTLGHWETEPTPERYHAEQGLLRRLHTQRGLFPLEAQLALDFASTPQTTAPPPAPFDELLRPHLVLGSSDDPLAPNQIFRQHAYLEARVLGFWAGSGSAYTNPVSSRRVAPCLLYWEWLVARGGLTAAESQRWRAWGEFLAELFASDHYYPGPATMRPLGDPDGSEPTLAGMANQNFYTDVFNIVGTAAQVFPEHAHAAAWRERALASWNRQLDYHVYPKSGVWEESHTYFLHVLYTMHALLRRWRDDGIHNFFADARLQRALGSLLDQVTPPDASQGGGRHLIAWGDHGPCPPAHVVAVLGEYAVDLIPHAAELAAHIAWLAGSFGWQVPAKLQLAPKPPPLVSKAIEGLGFVFRSQSVTAGEVLLALRSGPAWGHHHNDEGSLQLFGFGRALIGDVCMGWPSADGSRKFSAQGHSRPVPAGIKVANHFWRFSRGWISAYDENAGMTWAVARLPSRLGFDAEGRVSPLVVPVFAARIVLRLTAGLFVVVDQHNGAGLQEVYYHLAAERIEVTARRLTGFYPEGRVELIASGSDGDWTTMPRDIPAAGAPASQATWPCQLRTSARQPLFTVIALGELSDAAPTVDSTAGGLAVCAGERSWSLAQTGAGGWRVEGPEPASFEIPSGLT